MANSENRELAIKLTDVRKMYKLGQIGGGTLQADIQSWWAKKRGLEDPNTKIGEQRLIGQTFMALNGINLEVYKGEALGIIGGNGAGKSTMLKLLSRVTAPTSGKIQIWGRITSMLEVGTGFNGEMTGRENIYMNGAILGMTKAEIDAKMEDIIEFSEVRDFIDTPVKRYSSGMYVKLAFSVAAHLDSEIVIMDEVLAVGDGAFQEKCLRKMRSIAKDQSRTVLYVSHNMRTIRQLCDRCIVLDQGKIVYSGDVENAIYKYYALRSEMKTKYTFSERPEGNYKKVKINTLAFLNKEFPIYYSGEKMTLRTQWDAYEDIRSIGIRIVVCNNTHEPIGIFAMNHTGGTEKNHAYCDTLELNIDTLAEGDYTFFIVLYEMITNGSTANLDGSPGYIPFKVVDNSNNKLKWDRKYWGNIWFPDMSINREQKNEI